MTKIITIAQQKGGTGKTTLTAQLSVAFQEYYRKIIAVDIDPQASLSNWYDLRMKYYGKDNTGIYCIKLSGWKASNELTKLKDSHDLVIVDCPPHSDSDTKTVIRVADLIIIPLQASPTDLWATKTTIEFAQSENKEIILLLNRVTHNSKILREITESLPKLPMFNLTQRVAYASSMINGRTVIETEPNSISASELFELAKNIYKYL